jgi:hypothetical protein
MIPGQRLKLEPDFLIPALEIRVKVSHGRTPLLQKWRVGGIHRPLAYDQPIGEAFEHLKEQLLHRAKVIVNQPMVRARLLGEPAR